MIRPSPSTSIQKVILTLTTVLAFCGSVIAQEAARPNRGTALNRNYAISDIENINLQNGNVQLSIPLAALPPIAGGKLSFTVSANYNSKIWDVLRYQEAAGGLQWAPYVVDMPGWGGGWNIGSGYWIQIRNANDDFNRLQYGENSGLQQWELDLLNNHQWWKVVLFTPDGAEHELRPLNHGSYWGSQDFLRGFFNVKPNGSPMRYYSTDGSYLFATISTEQNWTIYMPDGTRITQTPDGVQRIQDTNGNKIKIFSDANGSHYQDEQTGREIRVTYDPAGYGGQGQYRVWFPTVTGIQHYIEINMGTTTVVGKTYKVNDWDTANEMVCQRTEGLFPSQLPVVREIVFPQTEPGQQRKFVFSYNSDTTENVTTSVNWGCWGGYTNYTRAASVGWGQLSRVILPPGNTQNSAYTDYSYRLDTEHSLEFSTDEIASNSIAAKELHHDGIVDSWGYTVSELFSSFTAPDGNWLTEVRYCATPAVATCSTDKAGLAYRINQPFLRTEKHWINLTFSGADVIKPGGVISFNPVVDYEYTTLLDAANNPLKMSAKAVQYDFNGNVTQTTEYDWFDPALVTRDAVGVPTGVPAGATVLRVTTNSHYNQAAGSASTNVYAKRSLSTGAPLILNAPQQTTIGPSIVQLSYDGQGYGVAPTVGNLTTKKVWADLDSKWITTSNTYGLYGNIATSTDARGKVTEFYYDDATHALPNRVVVDPQNGTGTQTTTTVFDYQTGLVLSQTDVNGQQSTIDYTNHLLGTIDPFGRPGVAKSPTVNISGVNHQRRVKTTYLDSARQVIVETDLNAENDKLLKTRTTADMLGRPVLTESTEDGTNYTISVTNAYLNMGKVTLTSSPRRSTAATTDSWTRVTKDIAGRVTEVATFGDATQPAWTGSAGTFTGAVTSGYSANFTTVTDQAGKVRRSMTDALGRLTRVDEPNASGSLGPTTAPEQPTSYAYNVLDNLTTVTQGSQIRTFTYDSLSRLRSAVNPESGTISYQYDDNGNLLVKTDARGVSAHYEYDSLNRATRRWYNASNSTSATTHNSPALPSGVGATDEVKFYYDTQALPAGAPSYSRGSAIGRLVAQTYGPGSNGDYYAYDVLGRPIKKFQQIGTFNYQLSADYTLSGAITTLTYPSNHTITNTFDQAGRLTGFSGNLGDGVTRTYATGILYSPLGGLVKEQFGTTTPLYNKLFYNSRSQLAEIRASTSYTGPTDYTADRGAIVNNYSNQCTGICAGASMPDNNGNLRKQEIHIPNHQMRWQQYEYDSLNRLQWGREVLDGGAEQWKQQFTYDRWGNRTIDTANTYGTGINNKAFTVNTTNNRLGVPGGQPGVMQYDVAGNLTNDTYSGAGNRTYDGENKITSAWGGNNQAQLYRYDGSGQRIKRTVDSVEAWQVYGFSGELLAEYAASAPETPQKEYGYRNGQLLITARGELTNFAFGKTATQSSTGWDGPAGRAVDGNSSGVWANGSVTHTNNDLNAWWQVDLGQVQSLSVVKLWNRVEFPERLSNFYLFVSDTPFNSTDLTATQNQPGVSSYYTAGQGGFPTAIAVNRTARYLRVQLSGTNFLSLAEVQAWGLTTRANVALAGNGAVASASSAHTCCGFSTIGAVNGNNRGPWGNGDGWNDATADSLPDWFQVDFAGSKTIDEIDVYSLHDNYTVQNTPTESQTFTLYGLLNFEVQYWNGSAWVTVPGGSVTGNNKVWRKFIFAPITTSKIRVWITSVPDSWSRIVEVEAYSSGAINWLVTDHLGTPRMIIDQTGSLANVKRHDYLPFGEELFAPTSGRSAAQGYASGDGVRQQFTSKERDVETGLDYLLARYYSSAQGRFLSIDPQNLGSSEIHPQSWNAYAYCLNNPLRFIDPDGLRWAQFVVQGATHYQWFDDEEKDENGQTAYDRAIAAGWQKVDFDESKKFVFINGLFAPWEKLQIVTLTTDGKAVTEIHTVSWAEWAAVVFAESGAGTIGYSKTIEEFLISRFADKGRPAPDSPADVAAPAMGGRAPYNGLQIDATGKVHGKLPRYVPKNWTRQELQESADALRASIRTRRAEQIRKGEHGPHRRRLGQEEKLLRQIEKKLTGS